jgi:hypothetical protein
MGTAGIKGKGYDDDMEMDDRAELRKLHIDVYEGRDAANPSIIGRLTTLESWRVMIDKREEKRTSSIETKLNLILAAGLGLIGMVIASWITRGH